MNTDHLTILAGIICLVAYLPLVIGILRDKIEQSFAAFMLWGMLDTIATITTVLEDGNFWLPFGNAFGSTTVAVLLVVKRQLSWSWIETMTSALVIICLVVWYTAGERAGIISSSLAVAIAGIPQAIETFKKPEATPVGAYLIFLSANVLSFAAGKDWSVEERFYAGCSILLCVVILLFTQRKKMVH